MSMPDMMATFLVITLFTLLKLTNKTIYHVAQSQVKVEFNL